jgi:hypothetical protein
VAIIYKTWLDDVWFPHDHQSIGALAHVPRQVISNRMRSLRETKALHPPAPSVVMIVASVLVLAALDDSSEPPTKSSRGSQPGRKQNKARFLSNGNREGLRRHEWIHQHADAAEFRRTLRVSRATYAFLKQRLVDKGYYEEPRKRARKDALSIDERISIALARMGTQAENESLGDSFGRSADTVSKMLDHFASGVVAEFREEFIKLPDASSCRLAMSAFMRDRGIPGCIGAIDGKHWVTCMGGDDELAFKDFHDNLSLTLLGIVDARYQFWWVSDIYAGATHDSRIWRASLLKAMVDRGDFPPSEATCSLLATQIRAYILGDSAFSGTDFILKPLTAAAALKAMGAHFSQKYNKLESSGRQCIEQAWGMVVNRFRIFKAVSEIKGDNWIERFGTVIMAGLILHNISIHIRDQDALRSSFLIDAEDREEIDSLPMGLEAWLK